MKSRPKDKFELAGLVCLAGNCTVEQTKRVVDALVEEWPGIVESDKKEPWKDHEEKKK